MLYWDSSALVALILDEPSAVTLPRRTGRNAAIAASFVTPLEIVSTLWRRRHAATISLEDMHRAEQRFAALTQEWLTIGSNASIEIAMRLVARHPLRTGDAIQLASAAELATLHGVRLSFVTIDRRLSAAALAEGFEVLP